MTAGKGILHIETPPEHVVAAGARFHGLQLWVNLPKRQKWVDPRYQDLAPGQVLLLSSDDGGALIRVIAGNVAGHEGPGSTYTPITMIHATVSPGAQLDLPWPAGLNSLVCVLDVRGGRGATGRENRPLNTGQLAVLRHGDAVTLTADTSQDSHTAAMEVLLL